MTSSSEPTAGAATDPGAATGPAPPILVCPRCWDSAPVATTCPSCDEQLLPVDEAEALGRERAARSAAMTKALLVLGTPVLLLALAALAAWDLRSGELPVRPILVAAVLAAAIVVGVVQEVRRGAAARRWERRRRRRVLRRLGPVRPIAESTRTGRGVVRGTVLAVEGEGERATRFVVADDTGVALVDDARLAEGKTRAPRIRVGDVVTVGGPLRREHRPEVRARIGAGYRDSPEEVLVIGGESPDRLRVVVCHEKELDRTHGDDDASSLGSGDEHPRTAARG